MRLWIPTIMFVAMLTGAALAQHIPSNGIAYIVSNGINGVYYSDDSCRIDMRSDERPEQGCWSFGGNIEAHRVTLDAFMLGLSDVRYTSPWQQEVDTKYGVTFLFRYWVLEGMYVYNFMLVQHRGEFDSLGYVFYHPGGR